MNYIAGASLDSELFVGSVCKYLILQKSTAALVHNTAELRNVHTALPLLRTLVSAHGYHLLKYYLSHFYGRTMPECV